eukprot:CAMPEP_0177632260 /NCGR_PEP_ID=MMETSP0447-20121125/2192_1 /TAXON_ID=0 /ORGANISM="Stygamoeba regulata, Strain BSH-02190019" /LENGTH=186 /DNA_ID=CAMNT_0019133807 /DNA_START=85 /DNA_END=645 /DNA_ORIENTATION=+
MAEAGALQAILQDIQQGVQQLGEKFSILEDKVTKLDEKVTESGKETSRRLGALEGKVTQLDEKVTRLDEKVTRLDEKVTKLEDSSNETAQRLGALAEIIVRPAVSNICGAAYARKFVAGSLTGISRVALDKDFRFHGNSAPTRSNFRDKDIDDQFFRLHALVDFLFDHAGLTAKIFTLTPRNCVSA